MQSACTSGSITLLNSVSISLVCKWRESETSSCSTMLRLRVAFSCEQIVTTRFYTVSRCHQGSRRSTTRQQEIPSLLSTSPIEIIIFRKLISALQIRAGGFVKCILFKNCKLLKVISTHSIRKLKTLFHNTQNWIP